MFSTNSTRDSIDILWHGKMILKGLKPEIRLEDGQQICLSLAHRNLESKEDALGLYKLYTYAYKDRRGIEKYTVDVSLSFKCYEEIVITSINGVCHYEEGYHIPAFHSSHGIKLLVEDTCEIDGLLAHYMLNDWWTRPYFKKSIKDLPKRTQSLLWQNHQQYVHLLPVCGDTYKTELGGNGETMEIMTVTYTGGYSTCNTPVFIMGVDDNPYTVYHKTISCGFNVLDTTGKMRHQRRYPESLEYLGWCSWNAFYEHVDEEGIIQKAEDFQNHQLPVKWFMIDHGWSKADKNKLTSFKEDEKKFSQGLNKLVLQLKEHYSLKWVGLWHGFSGHWDAIKPESDVAKEMQGYLYMTNSERLLPYPDAGKGFVFWNTWHRYLTKQGIDFVKVDIQSSMINYMRGRMAIGKAAREAHLALEASVGINFDNHVINCMGMASEQLWNRPISAVARNSNDFFPNRPGNFKEHALQNAYNTIYHGQFMWGDWDMWWTIHEDAINNAVLRAVSGGPLYISDAVNKTDPNLLWPLILSDGRILRCEQPGVATEDCLTRNPHEENIPLKVWSISNGAGIVGIFNVNLQGEQVAGTLSPLDIPDLQGNRFVLYEYFSEKTKILEINEKIDIQLEDNEVSLYIIIPLKNGFAPLGLINKYISPATLTRQYDLGDKKVIMLKEGGLFGFVAEQTPELVYVNGKKYLFDKMDNMYTIDCTEIKDQICLEIIFSHGKQQ